MSPVLLRGLEFCPLSGNSFGVRNTMYGISRNEQKKQSTDFEKQSTVSEKVSTDFFDPPASPSKCLLPMAIAEIHK